MIKCRLGNSNTQRLVSATMTTVKKPAIDQTTTLPYRLALNIRALEMTEDQFLQLCYGTTATSGWSSRRIGS